MSKFDTVLKRIEEAMPPLAPKPVVPGQNQNQQQNQQQNQLPDPKILQQLVAAIVSDNKKEIDLLSQQIRNSQQQNQQKLNTPGQTQQPAV